MVFLIVVVSCIIPLLFFFSFSRSSTHHPTLVTPYERGALLRGNTRRRGGGLCLNLRNTRRKDKDRLGLLREWEKAGMPALLVGLFRCRSDHVCAVQWRRQHLGSMHPKKKPAV